MKLALEPYSLMIVNSHLHTRGAGGLSLLRTVVDRMYSSDDTNNLNPVSDSEGFFGRFERFSERAWTSLKKLCITSYNFRLLWECLHHNESIFSSSYYSSGRNRR